ncbi:MULTISPECIES: type VII toxin-antitoxin system MntA family adenylyltransferase antitoxin [Priestia]|uniref:type VII toxin-antitoxin system MntA family adenylyltransferase antitoxin n=1 Tax=Priestia TaxID=2800373 RepID=UPI00203DBEA7|nr:MULTISPECIES: nucleotidyltransferase domain-containing protein [Priestia]MCM3773755.1 nucleotidyltransferase domain-containing protein [Priestia aryabhattai]MDY0944091.1 nucleotidyltransferase domain-containing protein [Priestia megaterium]
MDRQIAQSITEFLHTHIQPSFIIVFGSFAKGTTHQESDIDIAFYVKDKKLDKYEVFMLAQDLAALLKREVDLVNIAEASTVFQAQIYTTGEIIYSGDDTLRMNEQMKALKMYAKLNEERKDVLQKVDESGSIYEK